MSRRGCIRNRAQVHKARAIISNPFFFFLSQQLMRMTLSERAAQVFSTQFFPLSRPILVKEDCLIGCSDPLWGQIGYKSLLPSPSCFLGSRKKKKERKYSRKVSWCNSLIFLILSWMKTVESGNTRSAFCVIRYSWSINIGYCIR